MGRRTDRSQPLRLLLAAACWAGLFILYEVLAGSLSWPEAAAGMLASLLATIAVLAPGREQHLGRMPWSWWLVLARRIPRQMVVDTARVLGAAVGRSAPSGSFRHLPFEAGGDDPVSGSRRALVIAGASIAPNSYIAQVEPEHERLLTHQLVVTEEPPGRGDTRWPI